MISASIRKRARLIGSSACRSRICLRATSRFNSASRATKTAPVRPGRGVEGCEIVAWRSAGRAVDVVPAAGWVADRPLGVVPAVVGPSLAQGDVAECPADVRVAQVRQAFQCGPSGGNGGQARGDVAAVGLDVQVGQGFDDRPLGDVEVAECDQVVGQRPGLVAGPGVEGGQELRRLDQVVLQRE